MNIRCPFCKSQRVWKDGIRQTKRGETQRYICRSCGRQFSETTWNGSDESKRVERVHTTALYSVRALPYNRQVGVAETQGAKNLAQVEPQHGKAGAGATQKPSIEDIQGKIVEFAFWMLKQGYKESTVEGRITHLKTLVRRGANLLDPESVKKVMALQKTWSDGTKANIVDTYSCFLQMQNMTWSPPNYKRLEKIPFIPTEAELDQLIASAGKKLGTFLQGLKETGADPGELAAITLTDVNKEARTITINRPVKGHSPRIVSVSAELIRRLEMLPKNTEKIFDYINLYRNFYYSRKVAAHKLGNLRLLKITFITFRHWKGTMEYHRTKDILYVQKLLGHKNIQNTLIYINLEAAIFRTINDEFTVRVANNVEEACRLIETGFEYVTGEYTDGGKIFRKRK